MHGTSRSSGGSERQLQTNTCDSRSLAAYPVDRETPRRVEFGAVIRYARRRASIRRSPTDLTCGGSFVLKAAVFIDGGCHRVQVLQAGHRCDPNYIEANAHARIARKKPCSGYSIATAHLTGEFKNCRFWVCSRFDHGFPGFGRRTEDAGGDFAFFSSSWHAQIPGILAKIGPHRFNRTIRRGLQATLRAIGCQHSARP